MTSHNDDGFARNVGRMIEKEDEHIEHIDEIIMTKNDTGSDDDEEDDDRCERDGRTMSFAICAPIFIPLVTIRTTLTRSKSTFPTFYDVE